jgi:copper chaperone
MKTNDIIFKFKTNINCNGCVEKVSPFLINADGICHWDVDTANKDKILSVHSEGIILSILPNGKRWKRCQLAEQRECS